MSDRFRSPNSLPADHAFVVQFRPAAGSGEDRFAGRVEHIASGNAEYFDSQEELWDVLSQLLPREANRTTDK
jgi:hypothetical protein